MKLRYRPKSGPRKRGGFCEALLTARSTDDSIIEGNLLKAIDEHVGRQLRAVRRSRGISLEKLADKMNLSYQQLQKYERADDRISASRLYQIATFLKQSPDFFFRGLPAVEQEPLPLLSKEHTKLLSFYNELPEKSRKAALDIIRIMRENDV